MISIRMLRIWSGKLRIWSHLLKKSLMENFFLCSEKKANVVPLHRNSDKFFKICKKLSTKIFLKIIIKLITKVISNP